MFAYKIVAVVALAVACRGQIVGSGPCPNLEVVQDFDVARYLGTWPQILRFPAQFELGNCSVANYGPVGSDGKVKVRNTEVVNGEISAIEGTVELADPSSSEAKLIVRFHIGTPQETKSDYWVLGTDYDNYALVWSCRNLQGNINGQTAWVLARQKPIPAKYVPILEELVAKSGIRRDAFKAHDLEECRKFP